MPWGPSFLRVLAHSCDHLFGGFDCFFACSCSVASLMVDDVISLWVWFVFLVASAVQQLIILSHAYQPFIDILSFYWRWDLMWHTRALNCVLRCALSSWSSCLQFSSAKIMGTCHLVSFEKCLFKSFAHFCIKFFYLHLVELFSIQVILFSNKWLKKFSTVVVLWIGMAPSTQEFECLVCREWHY